VILRILLISSSPRKEKGSTFILAKEVLRGVSDFGVETEVIHLADQHINFCQHCQACHIKIMHCSVKDSIPVILNKMLEADGIILASPNYINQINAMMKALLERSSHFIHCKRLLGKYIAAVVTSGSGLDTQILDYIKYYAHICGAQYSGGVSSCEKTVAEKIEEAYLLGGKLCRDIEEKKEFSEQIKIIESSKEHFKKLIELRKDEWEEEYLYWQEKNWL